ncbi:Type 1 glutamine amidotransferase-like domain-containing protein [Lacticaseibacillus parakribbianus]|uniref:Type 1 glutamine amidotransferase-like domain-containing protein n=1 Tax=Lacticaseibacillus parakribbianus TaxID=2970927 RepID=UPI0021CB87F0|nr:Type 1 glutamine amidotransferase-like domain-containing protein [Lacticaseibacillus parakribbianus]
MDYLLTSGGIQNAAERAALVALLGKPIEAANALCIPTAAYATPESSPQGVWRFVAGQSSAPLVGLGWHSIGVLELTALPDLPAERWRRWLEAADALLVDGGDAVYLAYCLRRAGLADLLPTLAHKVWVGISAGSMVVAPRIGQFFTTWAPPSGPTDAGLGWLDLAIFPHLNLFEENNLTNARAWVEDLGRPGYVIDEQTAIQVRGGAVSVVSEGEWHLLRPGSL